MGAYTMKNAQLLSRLLKSTKWENVQWVSLGSYRQVLRKHSTLPGFQQHNRHLIHLQQVGPGFLRKAQVVCGVFPLRTNTVATDGNTTGSAPIVAGTDHGSASSSQTAAGVDISLPEGYIPEPPAIPSLPEVDLNVLGEPTLSSMGMASWYPSGLVQWGLESLHVGLDIPWWGAIVIGTLCIRLCMFPLVILSQRNAANMHNHMPTVQKLQQKFTHARMSGNPMEAARCAEELQGYMKRNKVNPFKNILVPLAQMPVFLSVFVGIRQMANYPVLSLKTGGILWFTDLTLTDPFYLLPLMTMSTLFLTIELGVDGPGAAAMSHAMKWGLRCLPLILFPVVMNFPTALLCYWATSNSFSLAQVLFLMIPGMKQRFDIPERVTHPDAKGGQKPFVQGFKDSYSNSKLMAALEARQRNDAVRFKESGKGPLQRTYSYDPTKLQAKAAAQVQAKSKS